MEVFYTVSYASCAWLCSFKILSTLKAYDKITLLLRLGFENSFVQKRLFLPYPQSTFVCIFA